MSSSEFIALHLKGHPDADAITTELRKLIARALDVVGEFVSRASNSPFTGMKLKGRVAATIVGGVVRHTEKDAFGSTAGKPPAKARARR